MLFALSKTISTQRVLRSSSLPINVRQLSFTHASRQAYPSEAPHALSAAAKKRSSPPDREFLGSFASLPSVSPTPVMPSHGTPHAGGPGDTVWLLLVPG